MSLFRPQYAGCVLVVLAVWLGTLPAEAAPPLDGHSFASSSDRTPPDGTHSVQRPASIEPASASPIGIRAEFAARCQDAGEAVLLLRQHCEIRQGDETWQAPLMVLWEVSSQDAKRKRVIAYLEESLEQPAVHLGNHQRKSRPYFLVELETTGSIHLESREVADLPRTVDDPVYLRAEERRHNSREQLQQTQYTLPAPAGIPPAPGPPRIRQRVTIGPRFLGERLEANGELSEGSIPPEYVVTLTGGVNIVVDNVPLQVDGHTVLTRIDLTADRAVVWTDANHIGELGGFEIDSETPFQAYLEGNIVVRQGNNVVRASHAFYDINHHRGLAMNAEVRTFLPDLQGSLRLRAAEVRQLSENKFHARDAFFTTSEFGKPKYRVQASDIFLEERFTPGPAPVNPLTGLPDNSDYFVTSLNNTIFVGDTPVFVAPYLSGQAEDPQIPIRKFNVGYSGMFGFTLETGWDVGTLFGVDIPAGIDWQLQGDYFSERGPAIGTRGLFETDSQLFGLPVHHTGWGQAYYLNDHGEDNLGLGRRDLPFPSDNRGRIILRDRITFSDSTWLHAEIGHVFNDDRNFLEQYYEYEWDTQKDLENTLFLNHQVDNMTATLQGTVQSNEFNDQTNWLPKADLTFLGEPVFGTPLVWSSHSSIGYGDLNPAQPPPNPVADPFSPQPYFVDVAGVVGMTRHELTLPFDVGPVHVSPYVLGELAYWEEDITGNSLGRAYGNAGIRGSVQFSKYMPQVRSDILGLNGLAHKVVYDFDYYYADSSEDLNNIAQYNEFDENAQERFRERYSFIEYGGVIPAMFDPRYYAVRYGAGRAVTASAFELVDDQQTLWLGMRHRWQTKVGPPGATRIVDWMEFDLGTAIFPDANDDNFGETLGLINSRYAWHISPRTSLLANGVFDVFNDGQRVWNAGVLKQRPGRGSMYLGFRQVDVGAVESQLVVGSLSYVMSPNLYVMTAGAQFDIAEGIDRGESVTITRIGEFFLLHLGLGYDRSRNNVGVALSLEPKFGSYGSSSMQLNSLLGIP